MTKQARLTLAALLGVLVIVGLILLWRQTRTGTTPSAKAANAGSDGVAPGDQPRIRRAVGADDGTPRENELGQPLDAQGRPIGPGRVKRVQQRFDPTEIPTTPPRFEDVEDRAEYRRWWVSEFARRISVFQRIVPRDDYPSAEETAQMLADYYDAAEPRGPDESVESAMERRRAWRRLWQAFLDRFHDPLQTLASRGGDPQYGEPIPPPVDPDSLEVDDPPAAPTATPPPGGPQ